MVDQNATPARSRTRPRGAPTVVFGFLALLSILGLRTADASIGPRRDEPRRVVFPPTARIAATGLGRSGGVKMRFALAGDRVDFPLQLDDSPDSLRYAWLPIGATTPVDTARRLSPRLLAPRRAGFYRLALQGPGGQHIVDGITLAVLVPFSAKKGATLNGYRIGIYRGEKRGLAKGPVGFLEVGEGDAALPVSEHLSLADFLTHDDQETWPRYAALDARLLDKLELVFARLAALRSAANGDRIDVSVHSGFRTPVHNRSVRRAAGDSRHQYGDAADVAVDADRDGRVTSRDIRMIERAVDAVEREHPDLVGGLGIYTRNGAPYAHIDTRGTRARWRG